MPRDIQGNFSLPTGTLVKSGDTVLVSQHNPSMQDIAQALTGSLSRTGRGAMLADLPMGGHQVKDLAPGVDPGDAVTMEQFEAGGGGGGGGDTIRADLTEIKAADTDDKNYIFPDGTVFTWETASAPYAPDETADFITTIESDNTAATDGAWVRQKADALLFGGRAAGVKGDNLTDDITKLKPYIQANSQVVNEKGGRAYLPRGNYKTGAKIDNPGSYSVYDGDGPRVTVHERKTGGTNFPAIHRNAGVQFGRALIRDMGFRGYTHGLLITDDTDGVDLDNVDFASMTSAAVQFDNQWQTSSFRRVVTRSCAAGFVSNTTVANAVRMEKCENQDTPGENIHFNGAEDFVVASHRWEGGGLVGGYTMNLANIRQLTFDGGYMESTHEYAARIVSVPGVITFRGVHFTGTGARIEGTAGPYKWLTDGTGTIIMDGCDFTFPGRVPPHFTLRGRNPNVIPSQYHGSSDRPEFTPGSTNFALVRFTRLNAVADAGNTTYLSGTLYLTVNHVDGGGVQTTLDRVIRVYVNAKGSAMTISAVTNAGLSYDTGTAVSLTNLTGTVEAGNLTGLLTINLAPLTTGVPVFKVITRIKWDQVASLATGRHDDNTFAVELQ